jgi:hypothetical protein
MEIPDQFHAPAALSAGRKLISHSVGSGVIPIAGVDVLETGKLLDPKIGYAFLELLGSVYGGGGGGGVC